MPDSSELYKQFGLEAPKPFSNKLALHVGEENNELRLIIKHHLQKLGFSNLRTCTDGETALTELKSVSADVALEGDDLSNIHGYDLLRELSEDPHTNRPAFIIISKPLNKSELMLALEKGFDEIMIRPLTQADLYPKIKSAYENFINPRNPERIYEYAKFKIRANDLDEATKVYQTIASLSDKAARPLVGLARVNVMRQKYEEALTLLTTAIDRNKNYIHAYALRGEVNIILKKYDEAFRDLKMAVDLSPLNVTRYEKAAEFLIKENRVDECLQILNIGVNAGLNHPFVIERTGFCHFLKKDHVTALRYLKDAVRMDPENVSYLNSLAICYKDTKDFEKAIQAYNSILKKQPENHLVLFNKAICLLSSDKKEEAIKALNRVVKLQPTFTKAQEKLNEISGGAVPAVEPKNG